MWYAVETVFIDGEFFGSKCFDYNRCGVCYSKDSEPNNMCERKFDDRIEIHTDWFETVELAEAFKNGEITYMHHYDSYYNKGLKSTFTRFTKREIVKVDTDNGILSHRGIYKKHPVDCNYTPYWAR